MGRLLEEGGGIIRGGAYLREGAYYRKYGIYIFTILNYDTP